MANRIDIGRLRLVGGRATPAEIEFKHGVNVVAGASDTGKSYLVGTLAFLLGSTTRPKDIQEAAGYEFAQLSLMSTLSGQRTFVRSLDGTEIYDLKGAPEQFGRVPARRLRGRHDAGARDTLSSAWLGMMDFSDEAIQKDRYNAKRTLRILDLLPLFLVGETRIVSEGSPILSDQYTEETACKSVFRLLLTGKDASEAVEVERPENRKAKYRAQIELVEEQLKSLELTLARVEGSDAAAADLEREIEVLLVRLREVGGHVARLEAERSELRHELVQREPAAAHLKELLGRFGLLADQYVSDRERLKFLSEGAVLVESVDDIHCPTCGQTIHPEHAGAPPTIEAADVLAACQAELARIAVLERDLVETRISTHLELAHLQADIDAIAARLSTVEHELNERWRPLAVREFERVEALQESRAAAVRLATFKERRLELQKQRMVLSDKLSSVPSVVTRAGEDWELVEGISHLTKCMSELLHLWGYLSPPKVEFSLRDYDFTVNGKRRADHGKGYRALLWSSFTIGLMKSLILRGMRHPGFVVLDSPITTLKERQRVAGVSSSPGDLLPENMLRSFYGGLLEFLDGQGQVVVFENREPAEELGGLLNLHYFSGLDGVGRRGFF